MIKLWRWLLGEYKLWKLRRQDPFIYEGDDEDDYDEDDVAWQGMIGFSEGFHDAAVAVVNNDEILFAAHSERYSKKKHDKKQKKRESDSDGEKAQQK